MLKELEESFKMFLVNYINVEDQLKAESYLT